MILVTPEEMEELKEHLQSRKDIWIEHNGVWVRSENDGGFVLCGTCKGVAPQPHEPTCLTCKGKLRIATKQYALAVGVKLFGEMVVLTPKGILWTQEATQQYVMWLLERFTAFPLRMEVVGALKKHKVKDDVLDVLSREICKIRGGNFVRKFERRPV